MIEIAIIGLLVAIGFTLNSFAIGLAEIYCFIRKETDGMNNSVDNLVEHFKLSVPAAKTINVLCSVGCPIVLTIVVGLVYGGYPFVTAGIAAICFTGNVLIHMRSKY